MEYADGKVITVIIYVRSSSWDAYMVAVNEYGSKITLSINPKNFIGAENTTWEDYKEEQEEYGAIVEVVHLGVA
tara:strand:- start:473 stop:694 length:222 start_codon:yes stop_codon:yes gene_type:complete